jgi:hypothetical protein
LIHWQFGSIFWGVFPVVTIHFIYVEMHASIFVRLGFVRYVRTLSACASERLANKLDSLGLAQFQNMAPVYLFRVISCHDVWDSALLEASMFDCVHSTSLVGVAQILLLVCEFVFSMHSVHWMEKPNPSHR